MKTIHWIIPIILSMLLSSCTEEHDLCRQREEGKIKFNEAQRQLVPYKKNAVVNFIDKNGKPVDFKVTENKRDWEHWYIFNEESCTDYFLAEEKYTVLSSISDDAEITLLMRFHESQWNAETDQYDGFLRWNGSCGLHIGMDLDYSGKKHYVTFNSSINQNGDISSENFQESLEINNHIYHNVFERKENLSVDNRQIPVQLFYNKAYGILQIKVNNGNYLMLNL